MFERLAHFILARRLLVSFVLAIVFFGLGGGLTSLNADFNIENFFQEKSHEAYKKYYDQWGRDDSGIFIVVTSDDESILEPSKFKVISELAAQLRNNSNVSRVVALSDFVRIRSENSTLFFEALEKTVPLDYATNPKSMAAWKQSVLEDPNKI